MPEMRKDPITGRWTIIAESRARRPHDFSAAKPHRQTRVCPFCEGNEGNTVGEIAAYRQEGTERDKPGWRARVVPNMYPALEIEGALEKRAEGMYDVMNGIGAHEVIIESPLHVASTSDLPEENIRETLWIYRDRLEDLKKDKRLAYGLIFKNVGALAGASLEHTHSQLIALPIVPSNVQEELDGSEAYFRNRGRCVYCDMIRQELRAESRVVLDTPYFLAFCPFASRAPFETWVIPKKHSSHYEQINAEEVEDLAGVLKRTISKIELSLDRPAYNYIVHTAPFAEHALERFHWHIEIIPCLTRAAGFEQGAGFCINPAPPERAAEFMREAERESAES